MELGFNIGAAQATLDVLLVLFSLYLLRELRSKHPTTKALKKLMESMDVEIAELRMKLKTGMVEVFDYVDGTLQPLHKRLVTRARREKDREESDEPKKPVDAFDDIRKINKGGGNIGLS